MCRCVPSHLGGRVVVGWLGFTRKWLMGCGKLRRLWRCYSLLQRLPSVCLSSSLAGSSVVWSISRMVFDFPFRLVCLPSSLQRRVAFKRKEDLMRFSL